MIELIAVAAVLVVLGLLTWWSAQGRARGPGDDAARRSYERGGSGGGL